MIAISRLLLVMMTVMLLTGCWNRIEINDVGIVTAIGLDLVERDQILLSLQVAVPSKLGPTGASSGGKEKGTFVVSGTGATVSEAYRNIQYKLSRRIFFSQSRVLLIGNDLAKRGISHIIDFHTRYQEPRINSFIMFTKGRASTIIKSAPNFESVSSEETKELARLGVGLEVTVMDFLNMLLTEGLEPVAPQFTLESREVKLKNKSNKTQAINGAAVFNKDKLAGWMDKGEVRGVLWVRNEMKEGVITIKIPTEKGGGNVSFELVNSKTKIIPRYQKGVVKLTVQVTSEMNVIENDSKLELMEQTVLEGLQQKIEKQINERIQLAVDIAQKKYQSDIFGFGQAIYKKYPKEWNTQYKNRWEQEFPDVDVSINSEVTVRRIGLTK
ncbi:Ger(x)C family spore germination protein [Neobacillus vireti]|uniref:Ger(x)C family spore germination protein n=1 Tax=Neobacillus vireti TaxID=220686 RepID=UPI002FFFCDD2